MPLRRAAMAYIQVEGIALTIPPHRGRRAIGPICAARRVAAEIFLGADELGDGRAPTIDTDKEIACNLALLVLIPRAQASDPSVLLHHIDDGSAI